MNVTYEHKPAMTFIGYSTSIRPEEGYQKCPEFWDREYAQKYARLWQTMQPETPVEEAILENGIGMFAICDEKEGSFEYWIAGLYKGGQVPEGLKLYTFPESDWAMFSAKGPLPGSLQSLNTQIWQEWYPNEGQKYRGNGGAIDHFRTSLEDQERIRKLTFYGAFDGDKLVGTLCMRAPQHIGGFFVDAAYHRRGIGRRLFEAMRQDYAKQEFTVNSSPYAVEVYRHLGFVPTGEEQTVDGLRFTPMQFSVQTEECTK